jgi:hypothetical protein
MLSRSGFPGREPKLHADPGAARAPGQSSLPHGFADLSAGIAEKMIETPQEADYVHHH